MDDVPRHRNSGDNNDDDTDHPGETTTGFSSQRLTVSSVLPLGEEEWAATRDGRNEELGSTQQQPQQQTLAFSPSHDTRASKRQRTSANDHFAAVPMNRSSSFNAPHAASLNAPLAASWSAAAASGIPPLNAPVDSIPAAGMFHGSQPSFSFAHSFESMGSPQPQQQRRDAPWHSNRNDDLSVAADQEATIEQWRYQQPMTRGQRGIEGITDQATRNLSPNLQRPSHAPDATQFPSQLEVWPQSLTAASEEKQSSPYFQSPFPPTGSMFRYAAEEKLPSPPFRQSLSPADTPASMLAQYSQQLRQQRPPPQQRHQLIPQQRRRQMAYDTMAPVSGTNTTGDVAAANAFDMRSPLALQSLPFEESMQDRPHTLSPLEMLLLSNRLSSSTVPNTQTSPAPPPPPNVAGISLPETNLHRHHGSTTIRPWSTMGHEPQSTSQFRVADSTPQFRAQPRTFASLNDEPLSTSMFGQSLPQTDATTSTLALLYQQQQQQQQQQRQVHDTANQRMAAPLGSDTDAMASLPTATAANMRLPWMSRHMPMEGPMQNRRIPPLSAASLSPLEMSYLPNRLNASQPTVPSWQQRAPSQSAMGMSQPGTTMQSIGRGPETTFPLVDSASLLTDWSESVSTLSEDQQPTIRLRQSPSPARTAASHLVFLNQLQQRQMERQQEPSLHAGGNTMVPTTATGAAAPNMRSPFADPTPRPTSTTLSPLETQYWLHRLNSSTALPTAPPWSTLSLAQQNNIGDFQPSAALEQHQPQIPQHLSDQAMLAQGGLLNLPMDETSSVSWPTNQRFSDAFQSYSSRNNPTGMTTTRAPEAAVAGNTRAISDPILPLPAFLARSSDSSLMSEHQTYLRCHIQLFCATMDDVTAPVRGRTKNVQLGQVGIQCCHCAHLPLSDRINGAVYFPATTNGIYQASLNMGAMHLQCGRCPQMPDAMKQHFAKLLGAKNMPSMVGRKYWAKTAIEMFGLVDTEHGIFVNSRAPAAA